MNGNLYGGSDPQLIEGDIFRMIISMPEFGEQASPGRPESGQSPARVKPESGLSQKRNPGPSQARVRPESNRVHVLMALEASPLAKSELAAALGHKSISGTLNTRIREMLAEDLIEYVIPDKPNSRLQKYRLTAKGRQQVSCRNIE